MSKGNTIGDAISEEKKKAIIENADKCPVAENDEHKVERKTRPRYKHPDNVVEALNRYPAHLVKLVNLVKSNSDIRRYTSLGILNYLCQKGFTNTTKGYVDFFWTKFSINVNGLRVEYRYTEPFFLNCLIASFTCFANAAQKIIKVFCSKELENEFVEDETITKEVVEFNENADAQSEDK